MNINKDAVIKIAGYVCTLAGAVIGMVSSNKDNAKNIEKAVENHLKNNK